MHQNFQSAHEEISLKLPLNFLKLKMKILMTEELNKVLVHEIFNGISLPHNPLYANVYLRMHLPSQLWLHFLPNSRSFHVVSSVLALVSELKMPTMKRPSSSTSANQQKKPAATINQVVANLKRGVSSVDLGDQEADENQQEGEKNRDKSKGQKYKAMKDQLPEHVVDLIEKESCKKSSPREFKTQVINSLFVRNESGKLELNLSDPIFEEHKRLYTKRFAKETDTAVPESIMKGLYFHNDVQAFESAKSKGDIVEVDCGNGKTFWAFSSYKKGKEVGSIEEQTLASSKKIDKSQAKLLRQAFAGVGWSWDYKEADVQKMISGNTIPASIVDLVKQATDSQNKLSREALVLIKGWQGDASDEKLIRLKRGHNTCQNNLTKLQYMTEFKELPDGLETSKENLDKLMMELAQQTADMNELIEISRGYMRAKKK